MTEIIPFKGITYNPGSVQLQNVLAASDAFRSADRRSALIEQNPNAIARLLAPPEHSPASDAVRLYASWSAAGIMTEEHVPVIYVIEQIFQGPGGEQVHRKGFIARWKIPETQAPARASIAPAAARIVDTTLWGKTLAALYDDPTRRIDRYLSYAVRSAPALNVVLDGIRTTLWRLNDGGAIAGIVREMKEKKIAVPGDLADFETASAVRTLCRSGNPAGTGNEPYNYLETLFINAGDPGIVSIPLHRCIGLDGSVLAGDCTGAIRQKFEVSEFADKAQFLEKIEDVGIKAIGVAMRGDPNYLLACLPQRPESDATDEGTVAQDRSAVRVFDEMLQAVCGADKSAPAITYSNTEGEAWEMLESDRVQMVCFVPPILPERIQSILSSDSLVPERMFDIQPSLPVGLVLHKLFE